MIQSLSSVDHKISRPRMGTDERDQLTKEEQKVAEEERKIEENGPYLEYGSRAQKNYGAVIRFYVDRGDAIASMILMY